MTLGVLLRHSLRRAAAPVLALGAILGVFQVLLVLVARSVQTSNAFDELGRLIPPVFRAMLGQSLASFMSFRGIVCMGYFHLVVMFSLTALSISLATAPAAEIETGFADLILSRPLARHWLMTRTVFVLVLGIAVVLCLMFAGTWLGLWLLAPPDAEWPRVRLILKLAGNLGFLTLACGGIALAVGAASRRRSIAAGLAGLGAVATFLLDYVGRAWPPARSVSWLSPFKYYSPFDLLLAEAFPAKNLTVLACISAASFVAAYLVFSRRDISH